VQFYAYTEPYYVSPTPPNNWNSSGESSFTVAVKLNWSADLCYFEWNYSTNTTMNKINSTYFNITKTVSVDGTYNYSVWCNSSLNGFWRQSQYRTVIMYGTEPDTTPPDIYNIYPTSGTIFASSTSQVTLSINTNEQAICRYSSGIDKNYSEMTQMAITNSTLHKQTVLVEAGKSYTIYFRCNDTSGNVNSVSKSTTFSIASTAGGGGGGGTVEYIINYRLFPDLIKPSKWTNLLPNSTWRTLVTVENQEKFPIIFKAEIMCKRNDSICAAPYCKLYVKLRDDPVPKIFPSYGVKVEPQKTGNMIVECSVPRDAKLGDVYMATLSTVGCKADNTRFCEGRDFKIQYEVRSWVDATLGSIEEGLRNTFVLIIAGFVGLVVVSYFVFDLSKKL